MRKPKKEIQLTSYDELLGINEAEQNIIYVKNFILRTSKDVKNNDESEESIQQNREVE